LKIEAHMESISIETPTILGDAEPADAVISEVRKGLRSKRKSLAPWLFYDDAGSALFEEITALPEYICFAARAKNPARQCEEHLGPGTHPQRVSVPLADLYLEFEAGETIHTENSYKYTVTLAGPVRSD
jgi:uncharacterized SAM-dependent methyltransferase